MSKPERADVRVHDGVNGGSPTPKSVDVAQSGGPTGAGIKAKGSPKLRANGRPHTPSPSSSPRLLSDLRRPLPPGWERVHSKQGVYYWNKETGKTRWKYPEDDAQEHDKLLVSHTYVNVKPVKPTMAGVEANKHVGLPPRMNSPAKERTSEAVPVPKARSAPDARRTEQTAGQPLESGRRAGKQGDVRETAQPSAQRNHHHDSGEAGVGSQQPALPQGDSQSSLSPELRSDTADASTGRRQPDTNGSGRQQPRISRHSKYVNDPPELPEPAPNPSTKPRSSISRHPKYVNDPSKQKDEVPTSSKISRHSKYVNDSQEERAGRRGSTGSAEKSTAAHMIPRQHRYVNVPPYHLHQKTSPAEDYSSEEEEEEEEREEGGGVSGAEAPPPVSTQVEDGEEATSDTDDTPTPTPTSPSPSPAGTLDVRDTRSPTPPIPDRKYSESDIGSLSPPPLPERRYGSLSPPPPIPLMEPHTYSTIEESTGAGAAPTNPTEVTSSAPPTPSRNTQLKRKPRVDRRMYETLDDLHLEMEAAPEGKQHRRFTKSNSVGILSPPVVVEEGAEGPERESGHEQNGKKKGRVVQRTGSQSDKEYALINPAWKRNVQGRPPSLSGESGEATLPQSFRPPPLPERASEGRKHEPNSAPNARQRAGRYIEVDIDRGRGKIAREGEGQKPKQEENDPYKHTIAYAIVKLDSLSDRPIVVEDSREARAKTPPEPYEVPLASKGTLERGLAPPSYEEINYQDSPQETAGYMVVDREVQQRFATLQQTHGPTPGLNPPKTAAVTLQRLQSPSPPPLPARTFTVTSAMIDMKKRRKDQLKKSTSSDISQKDSSSSSPSPTPSSSNPPDLKSSSPDSSVTMETEEYSRLRRNTSPDSMDSGRYSDSRRLAAMNVTLRRTSEQEAPVGPAGYSTVGMSRDALLLRSGVTLRRSVMSNASLTPLEQFARQSGYSMDESGSGSGSQTDEDDSLEPVNKCIKSLETSLRLKGDGQYEEYMEMQKAPEGPPKWIEYKRRPHEYESIKDAARGAEQERRGGGRGEGSRREGEAEETPRGPLASQSMMDLGAPEMAWDESDFAASSMNGATSVPNLLTSNVEQSFPHMVKPERVSDQAFNLRKLRLLHHMYEDIDISEWPDVGGATPSDVAALNSAIRGSWMESEGELAKGWKIMNDEAGNQYYWHVPSGKTQYTTPTLRDVQQASALSPPPRPEKGKPYDQPDIGSLSPLPEKVKAQTFSCRYRGYHFVEESELVPGQCVKVVHACINRTSSAIRNSMAEEGSDTLVEKGKVVFLQIQGMELRWLNPETSNPHAVQPINKIRVWGIGLENERDFGYVARDPATKKHMCHVFRCDMPARAVARALLESHQREKKAKGRGEQSEGLLSVGSVSSLSQSGSSIDSRGRSLSPDYIPATESLVDMEAKRRKSADLSLQPAARAPSDRYTRISCTYIGSCEVPKATGMEVLNDAVEKLRASRQRWIEVNVDIATSHIKITDIKTDTVVREHRVRFLCFLGIATDDRFCGYVVDSGEKGGEKHFHFHGFQKEPNTDRLCLALHCACQARYQRVLDSNPESCKTPEGSTATKEEKGGRPEKSPPQASSSSSSGLFGRLGSFKKTKKLLDEDPKSSNFVVFYLGSLPVSKAEGLETVKEPVQQLSVAKGTAHLVEFEVTSTGMSITDPQRRVFSRKTFAVKNITYVVRIRNYFAFIAKESGKFHCHAFKQSEVDTGTIVTAIQRLLAPESLKQKK